MPAIIPLIVLVVCFILMFIYLILHIIRNEGIVETVIAFCAIVVIDIVSIGLMINDITRRSMKAKQ